MKLDDLPPHLRQQAEEQLNPHGCVYRPGVPPKEPPAPPPRPPTKKHAKHGALVSYAFKARRRPPFRAANIGGMTKTEAAYQRDVLRGRGRFEPISFHLLGGSRYTPDFMTVDDGVPTFHEVKGSYRLESEGRAWTAFNEAAAQYPMFRWIWAVRTVKPTKGWTVKRRIEPGAPAFDNGAEAGDMEEGTAHELS